MLKREGQLITVIGGGGFVGRYLVQQLLADGARVRIAQRNPRQATFLRPLGGLGQTQFVRCDVGDLASVQRAIQGSHAVINLAGSFTEMQKVQAEGAKNVAQAVQDQKIGIFVHQSAIGAGANSPSLYGRTKAAGEAAVRGACSHAVILRPSIIFGREDQFINRFAQMIRNLPIVPVIEGKARFQPVYVGDVANALMAALEAEHQGQLFELGGPRIFTMAQLLRWIAQETGHDRKFINVSGGLIAALPFAPLSKDQLRMLQIENIVADGAHNLESLGIYATPLEVIADDWLVQYRHSGRFALKNAV